jgi:hypothetical protein
VHVGPLCLKPFTQKNQFIHRGLVNFLSVELLYFLALDEGSIQGFHERFEFLSLVFWAYRTSIQSTLKLTLKNNFFEG